MWHIGRNNAANISVVFVSLNSHKWQNCGHILCTAGQASKLTKTGQTKSIHSYLEFTISKL